MCTLLCNHHRNVHVKCLLYEGEIVKHPFSQIILGLGSWCYILFSLWHLLFCSFCWTEEDLMSCLVWLFFPIIGVSAFPFSGIILSFICRVLISSIGILLTYSIYIYYVQWHSTCWKYGIFWLEFQMWDLSPPCDPYIFSFQVSLALSHLLLVANMHVYDYHFVTSPLVCLAQKSHSSIYI